MNGHAAELPASSLRHPLRLLVIAALLSMAPGVASAFEVVGRDASGAASFIQGRLGAVDMNLQSEAAAVLFLRDLASEHLQATGDEELVPLRVSRDAMGNTHVRIQQRLNGLPVMGTHVVVHYDPAGEVYALTGRFVAGDEVPLPSAATLSGIDALELAASEAGLSGSVVDGEPELVYVLSDDATPHLAWRNRIQSVTADGTVIEDLFAAAVDGSLVTRHPRGHRVALASDTDVVGPDLLFDYYEATFSHSFDDASLQRGEAASSLQATEDGFRTAAHDFAHGLTARESGLILRNESGSLSEAWSEIFAATAAAWAQGVQAGAWDSAEVATAPDDALVALAASLGGDSLDYYPERYVGPLDNGGVRQNSGIAKLAFYLSVYGGEHPRGKSPVEVSPVGLARSEQIFHQAQHYLTPSSDFMAARQATGQAALDLYGTTDRDRVLTAWCSVGVGSCPLKSVPIEPPAAVDDSRFVKQLLNLTLVAGQLALVEVTMENQGTTIWTRVGNYKLGSQSPQDNTTWGVGRVLLPSGVAVAPGQRHDFVFTIQAPTTPGTYDFQWRMLKEGVHWFGDFSAHKRITVIAPANNSQFISLSGVPTSMARGQRAKVSVIMKNTGNSTWTRPAGHRLGSQNPQDNTTWGLGRVLLPRQVLPGQQVTFTFNITAPSKAGTYNFRWRMLQEAVEWFGAFTPNRLIVVH